eukprot:TRINITY_DN4594_c0_g1_i2.p1 TRINITY_DN4594_c0_g1~~TRINITY_DN4594_c0_g1_i2.p1  ORF type:complete len:706 (-),score=78.11 TRINITY_DN4594_c0_g1_i2:99-2174(-)
MATGYRVVALVVFVCVFVGLSSAAAWTGRSLVVPHTVKNLHIDARTGSSTYLVATDSSATSCPNSAAISWLSLGSNAPLSQPIPILCTSRLVTDFNISAAINVGTKMLAITFREVFLFDLVGGAWPAGSITPVLSQNSPFWGPLLDGATITGVPHFAAHSDSGFVFGPTSTFTSGSLDTALVQFSWDLTLYSDIEPTGRHVAAIGTTYSPEELILEKIDRATNQSLRIALSVTGDWYSTVSLSVSSSGLVALADWGAGKISFYGGGVVDDLVFSALLDGGQYANVSGAIALNSAGTLLAVSPNGRYGSVCPTTNGFETCVLLYARANNSWSFSQILSNSISNERLSAIEMAWSASSDILYAYDNVTRKFWEFKGPAAPSDNSGNSPFSLVLSEVPAIQITKPSEFSLSLTFSTSGASGTVEIDGLEVEYKTGSTGSWTSLFKMFANDTSSPLVNGAYVMSCLQPGATYYFRARYLAGAQNVVGQWSAGSDSNSIIRLDGLSGFKYSVVKCGGRCTAAGGCTIQSSCTNTFTDQIVLSSNARVDFDSSGSDYALCTVSGLEICCNYTYYYSSSSYYSRTATQRCGTMNPAALLEMNYESTIDISVDYGTLYSITSKTSWTATVTASSISGQEIFRAACPNTVISTPPSGGSNGTPGAGAGAPGRSGASALAASVGSLLALVISSIVFFVYVN